MEYEYAVKIRRNIVFLNQINMTLTQNDKKLCSVLAAQTYKDIEKNCSFEILKKVFPENYLITHKVVKLFSRLVLTTDMYLYLREKECISNLTTDENILKVLTRNSMENYDFSLTLFNFKLIHHFIKSSSNFIIYPRYQKYLVMHILTEEEVNLLTKFNPLFQYEYEHYNFIIDSNFVVSEIDDIIKQRNLDEALFEIYLFLINMYTNNKKCIEKIMNELVELLDYNLDFKDECNDDALKNAIKKLYDLKKENTILKK